MVWRQEIYPLHASQKKSFGCRIGALEYYIIILRALSSVDYAVLHTYIEDICGVGYRCTYLAIAEWGTWHDEDRIDLDTHQRQTMRDAVFAAKALHIFYRNSDVVAMAMQTQTCNLNESLFDTNGKHFVKTPTFWVMKLFKEHLNQYVLDDAFVSNEYVDALATVSENGKRVVLTAANSHLYESKSVTVCDEIAKMTVTMSDMVFSEDVRNYNSFESPDLIREVEFSADLPRIVIPPHSVIRIVFE